MKHLPAGFTVISRHYPKFIHYGISTGIIRVADYGLEYEFDNLWYGDCRFVPESHFEYHRIITLDDYFPYRCARCGGAEPKGKGIKFGVCMHCGKLETKKNFSIRDTP